jgi:hypothetical protein
MNVKKVLLWLVLISFSLFSVWVTWEVGYVGLWQAGFASPASLQILLDLCISAGLICLWIIADARQRGDNPWPWVVAVVLLGSVASLAYLIRREPAARGAAELSRG